MKKLLLAFTCLVTSSGFAQSFNPCQSFYWSGSVNPVIDQYQVSFLTGNIPDTYPQLRLIQGTFIKEKWSKQAASCLLNDDGSGLFSHPSYVLAPTLGKVLVILNHLQETAATDPNPNFQSRLQAAHNAVKTYAGKVIGDFENFLQLSVNVCTELNSQSADIDGVISSFGDPEIFSTLAQEFCSQENRQKIQTIKKDCEEKLDSSCNLEDLYGQIQDCEKVDEANPSQLLQDLKSYQQKIKTAATGCGNYRRTLSVGIDQIRNQP